MTSTEIGVIIMNVQINKENQKKGGNKMKGCKTEYAKFKSIMSKVKKNRPEVAVNGKVKWGAGK